MRSLLIVTAALLPLAARGESIDWHDPQSVVRAAIAVSPALAAMKNQIAASRERVIVAGTLPNPMVVAGVQNQQINLSVDRQMTMYAVGASQTLTRKSRRDAERGAAESGVRRLQNGLATEEAEIEREVLFAYFDAAAASSQAEATSEISALTGQAVSASRARYETGAAPQADIIRALLDQKSIDHQLLALESRRKQAAAKLAALLHVPPGEIPKVTLVHDSGHAMTEISINLESPAIGALQAEVDEAEQEIRLAQLAVKPDINLEASYGFRPYEKDTISVMGRIELPYRRKTLIEPRVREAIANRDAAKQRIEILRQRLRQDIGVAAALHDEAVAQIQLHESELVPAAKMGFESALASYQTGKESFESVLASLRSYVALRIDYFDFLEQELRAEADIAALRKGARQGAASSATSMEVKP